MQAAIDIADYHKTPFGAVLAMGDDIFATASSPKAQQDDPEKRAICQAMHTLSEQIDKQNLSGFVIYTTCEPSPYCINQARKFGIEMIVFGCENALVSRYLEYNQPEKWSGSAGSQENREITLRGNFMKEECEALLQKYS